MTQTRPIHILAIDDDESALATMRKMVESQGLSIDTTRSAPEALELLRGGAQYDAILCDMWMPDMTGADFYNRLNKEFVEYRTRIVFVTGDIASPPTWHFIGERGLPYVLKPYNVSELRRKVEEVTGSWVVKIEPLRPAAESTRRRHRRVAMKADVRIRSKNAAANQSGTLQVAAEVAQTVNVSKGGLCFTASQDYPPGTEVWVAFPYTGVNDVEQPGYVVWMAQSAASGSKYDVGLVLGDSQSAGETTSSDEDRRRNAVAPLTTSRLDALADQLADSAELRESIKQEREQARRLVEEMTELRATFEHVATQRDRLAAQETQLRTQLDQLTGARKAMTEAADDLTHEVEELQQRMGAAETVRFQATHDALTGVWNRDAIVEILRRELARMGPPAQRPTQANDAPVGVILADLHQAGDAMLRETARRLSSAVRDYDAVGRYADEQFLIVLAGCDQVNTMKQAQRIRELIGVPVSIGIATGSATDDCRGVIHHALGAMNCAPTS